VKTPRVDAPAPEIAYEIGQGTIALAGSGALLMVIATFVPYAESTSFVRVSQNSLIQHEAGWMLIGLAVIGGVSALRSYSDHKRRRTPWLAGVAGLAIAILAGTTHWVLELCPVGAGTALTDLGCEKASPGIGIYMAGAGSVLLAMGGRLIRRAEELGGLLGKSEPIAETAAVKTCPECAEEIRAAAKVCRFCGFRFEIPPSEVT